MAILNRRQFHKALLGSVASLCIPRIALADATADLVAAQGRAGLAPAEYPETDVWAFGGSVPGPTIRLAQGARLSRRFVNDLPQPSSIHWHGILSCCRFCGHRVKLA